MRHFFSLRSFIILQFSFSKISGKLFLCRIIWSVPVQTAAYFSIDICNLQVFIASQDTGVPPLLSCRHPSRAGSHPPLRDALIFLLFGELQLTRTYRTNSQMGTAFFAKGLPHYPQKARFSLSWHQCLYCTGKAAAVYPPAATAGQFPPA